MRRAFLPLLAGVALTGCGGGSDPARPAPAPPAQTTPPPPGGAPASTARYARALDRYCAATVGAVDALAASKEDKADPVAPVAAFARSYRAGLERFARVKPPAALCTFHLFTLATSRESANRIDDGVRLGRGGDTDAATTALGEVSGLLPASVPAAVRRRTPHCTRAFQPKP